MYKDVSSLPVLSKDEIFRELRHLENLTVSGRIRSLVPLLPLMLNLEGSPYSLRDHFPFEGLFDLWMPRKMVLKTGRQVSKSTSIAAHGVVTCASHPNFKILYVTPLYEQIRRFSNNYVNPFIVQSPIKNLLVNTQTDKSVLQRSFINNSIMHFSYALLSADRTRGIKADKIAYDEVQDLDANHIPIINETMSHSKWSLTQFTGTPKTRDNTLEGLWQRSSQAEWFTPCSACKHDNIATLDHDLMKMIGPFNKRISRSRPAIRCAKCDKRIDPRNGFWVHKYPSRRLKFVGYHVPQVIMPIHYTDPDKWSELLAKMNGVGNITKAIFYNEVLGESCDESTKLVTKTDLEKAGCLDANTEENAVRAMGAYQFRVLAIDWGGGGEEGVSFTTLALLGLLPNGTVHVIYGKRLLTPHDHLAEASECLRVFKKFNCQIIAHDYTGAGNLREQFLVQSGAVGIDQLIPVHYVRSAKHNIMTFVPATVQHPRNTWRVDKARSLQLVATCVKLGTLKFFKYDYKSDDEPGLLHDFLALYENKVPTNYGSDIYTIQRNPNFSDDFAQAVNIGCCGLWQMTDTWPRFNDAKYVLDAQQTAAMGTYEDPGEYGMGGYLGVPGR